MKTVHQTLSTALLLACAAGASTSAMAQAAKPTNFTGPAVGIALTAQRNTVDYTSSLAAIDGKDSSASDSDASLIASWGFAMSPDWVGTAGLSIGTKSVDFGSTTYVAGGTQTITAKTKDHWSVSFAPGYRIGADSLVYAKLAYHQITGVYTDTLTAGGTTTHRGTGIGLGYAMALSNHIELRGEYESVTFSSDTVNLTTGKPQQKSVTLGLLYKF